MTVKFMGLVNDVANYYAEKLSAHGNTPQGVDWNGEVSQIDRFIQLLKVVETHEGDFSINDLGCGYGALLDYLRGRKIDCEYVGIDVSQEMISAASDRHALTPHARFINSAEPDILADYGVASGIFNVRLKRTDDEWYDYLQSTLDILDRTSRYGFSFNCLTSYSDEEKKRDYLYYAEPNKIFDLCKRRYSHQVALLHDYGLYEFTILVRKNP
jgi:SAM-dependent methyltransferase